MENLKYTFDQINNWIEIADQKAFILGSLNIAGFIYQLVNLDKIKCASVFVIIVFSISILSTLLALFFWLRIIYPRLDNKHKKSKIFFQHIANAYGNDIASGVEDLQKLTTKEYEKDLASQIIANSVVTKKKYRNIQKFIWVFGIQIITMLLLIILLAYSNSCHV